MWNPRRHILDFSALTVVGTIATMLDAIAYAYLLQVIAGTSYDIAVAAVMASAFGGLAHFALCRYWAFQRFDKSLMEALIAYVVMSAVAALVHGSTTHLLALYWGPMVGWGASKTIIFLAWTYPMSRYFVFGELKEEPHSR